MLTATMAGYMWGSERHFGRFIEKFMLTGLTYRRHPAHPWDIATGSQPVTQRSIIAGLSTLSLIGAGRFGMITTGTGTTITTMPRRAGRV